MVFMRNGRGRGSGEHSEFQESLLAIAAARDARIADAKAARDAFIAKWEKVRDAAINPVFRETVDCLHSGILNISWNNENGCGSVLQNAQNFLRFKADQEHDRIICSGQGIEEEQFDFDLLTRERVEPIVRKFVDFCINQIQP